MHMLATLCTSADEVSDLQSDGYGLKLRISVPNVVDTLLQNTFLLFAL